LSAQTKSIGQLSVLQIYPFLEEGQVAQPQETDRPARADALQNRERILAVALAELTHSADVPLSAIAKKAGVGRGTFYRHFPTREALVMEVYRHEMLQVAKFAEHLLQTRPPDQALREWMNRLAEYAMTKAGLANAIREVSMERNCPGNASIWQIDFNDEWQPRFAWLMDFVMAGLRAGAPVRPTSP
jgi:AcrR family transcriptional regulator